MVVGTWGMESELLVGRERTETVDSTGDDLELFHDVDDDDEGADEGAGEGVFEPGSFLDEQAVTEDFEESLDREVSLDGELSRTMSTFMRSERAVATIDRARSGTLIDGEVVELSDDEPEPEPEPEPGPGAGSGGHVGTGPRFNLVRVKQAAVARAAPSWQGDGRAACMWCDISFDERTWQQHCRRCGWAVCDACSPHRQGLDVWLDGNHPHAVQHERSSSTLRVCVGCARAADEPGAAPKYFLATMSRISDQITVRQVGPSRADALLEWEHTNNIDSHALFELQLRTTAATAIKKSWLMLNQTVNTLKAEVEDTATAQQERAKTGPPLAKTAEMWLDSRSRTERESISMARENLPQWDGSTVSLDYRNFTITVMSGADHGADTDQLARHTSYAVVRQSVSTESVLRIHCGDCRTVAADGLRVTLTGLSLDDGAREEGWEHVLITSSEADAEDWRREISEVCKRAKSHETRFQRLRMVQTRRRHEVHERLHEQRATLDAVDGGVWPQFEGLSDHSKNKLLRKLTKEEDKRVPGVRWVAEGAGQCSHIGCEKKVGTLTHSMHHCRLCGEGVCGSHFRETGVHLPASTAHEGVPPEPAAPAMEPREDQSTPLERKLYRSRSELRNTEVDIYSESARDWVVGRITAVDTEGDVTVSYSGVSPAPSDTDQPVESSWLKTITSTAASSIRLHQGTLSSGLSLPVCVCCMQMLRTVDDLPNAEGTPLGDKLMREMADDFRAVKLAGVEAALKAASLLNSKWKTRETAPALAAWSRDIKQYNAWLKAQSEIDPADAAWRTSMATAGLTSSSSMRSPAGGGKMDMVELARTSVSKMLKEAPGIKALIVDDVTKGFLGSSHTTTSLAEQGVVIGPLLLPLSLSLREGVRHRHVRAVVWVRPVESNIQHLIAELQNPRFSEYHICFSNRDERNMRDFLERLAVADVFETIRGVSECLGEYAVVSPELFVLEVAPSRGPDMSYSEQVRRLQSVIFALRRQPIIRYSTRSQHASAIAHKLAKFISGNDSPPDSSASGGRQMVLLIVDRDDDPFTPLMNQWTFMAMTHELLLEAGSVGSSCIKFTESISTTGEVREIGTLPPGSTREFGSSFLQKHMHSDFGLLCEGYERLKADRLALKARIEQLNASGDLKQAGEAVRLIAEQRDDPNHKHDLDVVPLVQELEHRANRQLAEMVSKFQVRVMDYSESDRYQSCEEHLDELMKMLESPLAQPTNATSVIDEYTTGGDGVLMMAGKKLQRKRAILTFVLRYPTPPQGLKHHISAWLALCTPAEKLLIRHPWAAPLIPLKEVSAATEDYKEKWDIDPRLMYRPRLEWTLHRLLHKKLSEQQYAFCSDDGAATDAQRRVFANPGQLDVVVFFVGGVTCQEARIVHEFNGEMQRHLDEGVGGGAAGGRRDMRVICGGDLVTSGSRHCSMLAVRQAEEKAAAVAEAATKAKAAAEEVA